MSLISELDAALTRVEKEIELLMQEPGQDALRECRAKTLDEAATLVIARGSKPYCAVDPVITARAIRTLAQTEAGEDTP